MSQTLTLCILETPKGLLLFVLMLSIPVNSYGHVKTVSLPYPTFFLCKLVEAVNQ